jgi:hypothetical protein
MRSIVLEANDRERSDIAAGAPEIAKSAPPRVAGAAGGRASRRAREPAARLRRARAELMTDPDARGHPRDFARYLGLSIHRIVAEESVPGTGEDPI